jgi:hypothetical protein
MLWTRSVLTILQVVASIAPFDNQTGDYSHLSGGHVCHPVSHIISGNFHLGKFFDKFALGTDQLSPNSLL